jgi:UDP-GlcNAc:undecaprenyl-phosphate GlcNAc-1-phosphate transferase
MAGMAIAAGLVGFATSWPILWLIIRRFARNPVSFRSVDLHHMNGAFIPRFGGIALAAAFLSVELLVTLCGVASGAESLPRLITLSSSLAIFAVGLWDDVRALCAKRKLILQVMIALAVCCFGIGIQRLKLPFCEKVFQLGGWGVLLTVLWLVSMTNLINFIDGVDGLAGGVCLMLMTLVAYVGQGSAHLQLIATGMVGALIAFLRFNFPPARIYLGDGGAYFLGFLIGLLALVSSHKGEIFVALVSPLFVLAWPILDMVLAILRRGLRGLPVFRADRRHIHHQLLRLGISRRRLVLGLYFVTFVFLVLGLGAFWSRGRLVPVLLGVAMLIFLVCAGNLRFSRKWFAANRVVSQALKIRPSVRYALAATRLLGLEGARGVSVDGLWLELIDTGRRLGFTFIKLSMSDGDRIWEKPLACRSTYGFRQLLQGGCAGVLELKAPNCPHGQNSLFCPAHQDCSRSFCPRMSDETLFEITSELLAEGWLHAISNLRNRPKH